MNTSIPRPEHPNPIWERDGFVNLNGSWEFDFDFGRSALDRRLYESDEKLPLEIVVPFCPESRLSGIAHTDFINCCCYRRKFEIPADRLDGRIVLHFGAVDYKATVYVNGKLAGTHKGGYTPFEFDIAPLVRAGENSLFVFVEDDTRSGAQPSGKQSKSYHSHGCDYTRTTGIWQTVWLEFMPKSYIKSAKYYPDIDNCRLTIIGEVVGAGELTISAAYEGRDVGSVSVKCLGGGFIATLELSEKHLWQLGVGGLYDLTLTFGGDRVKSYFGLRSVSLDDRKFYLNGRVVFQRTVLDQGYYPDGIYTAPTDADLEGDVVLSMNAGFNGARLHQKVFEPRFLYHCDRLGYMVWGEMGNWGLDYHSPQATEIFGGEWLCEIERDFNHPSIIGWCPFNETWNYVERSASNALLSSIYHITKAVDPTRPVIDTSGGYHHITDIYDLHDYEQDPNIFGPRYEVFANGGELYDRFNVDGNRKQAYGGEPVFMSEYGGIQWNTDGNSGWGYGQAPKTPEEFIERYRGLTNAMLDNPAIMGFCYTQLYDIEQEINGLYTYGRKPKFDISIFREINTRKAAIED